MTQQFSKLNKLGNTFKKNKNKEKTNFTIGSDKNNQNDSSSDSDDAYEHSIFQPNESVVSGISSLQFATDSSSNRSSILIEQGLEVTENTVLTHEKKVADTFLPSVGIVMGNTNETTLQATLEEKENLMTREDSSQVDNVQLSSIMQNVSLQNIAPEIIINSEELIEAKKHTPSSLKLDKKLSHSSGEVDEGELTSCEVRFDKRSTSNCDVTLNISQSQSESALKNKFTNITSPVATVTKDLVFTPFTKLAKGVQNFGANLDPRKLGGQVRHVSEKEIEEHRKLQEKWQNSKTRLIAL